VAGRVIVVRLSAVWTRIRPRSTALEGVLTEAECRPVSGSRITGELLSVAPEFVLASVKPHQEAGILDCNPEIGFARPAIASSKFEGNLLDRLNTSADENFKKQLEARPLESDLVETMAANHEEARHRVFGADAASLQRPSDPDGGGGEKLASRIPMAQRATWGVAAPDHDVSIV